MPSRHVNELTRMKDRAARCIAKGNWNDALDALGRARELAPKDTYIARKIGDMHQRLGRKPEAVEAYKQAARLFAAAGFLVKAISINKIILSLDPDDKEVQGALASLYSTRRSQEGWEDQAGAVPAGAVAMSAVEIPEATAPAPPAEPVDALSIDLATVDASRLPWTPLFSDLDENELNRVIDKLVPVFAAAGTVICREGEVADSLYVIASGLVRVSSRGADNTPLWLTNLSEGAFFGEFGFFSNGKRHADVVATEDTELLQIVRADIEDIVREFPRVRDVLERFYKVRVLDTLLAKSQLFKSLTPDQRMDLLNQASVEVHAEGSMIIQEGDDGVSLYVVKSGEVNVYTDLSDKRIDLAVLRPGDIFGEISLLTGTPTTANVVAPVRTELVKFSKSEVESLAGQHPQLAHLLSETKEHRVHETVQRIQTEGFV